MNFKEEVLKQVYYVCVRVPQDSPPVGNLLDSQIDVLSDKIYYKGYQPPSVKGKDAWGEVWERLGSDLYSFFSCRIT